MLSALVPARALVPRWSGRTPRLPSLRTAFVTLILVALLGTTSTVVSTLVYLRLPAVTGSSPVGRAESLLSDPSRMDRVSPADHRQIRLLAWYPAVPGTGVPAQYVPGLDEIRHGLEASGELNGLQVAGLALVEDHAREGGEVATFAAKLPVVLLSPGNATNVAFYAALAEDLASHGYVVIGLDHPYQVAAVDLGGGKIATYPGDVTAGGLGSDIAAKIDERVADVSFVLDRLAVDAAGLATLAGRLDLSKVAMIGHSNGGIAAAQACQTEPRIHACVNIDGQSAGGPFSARVPPQAPTRPFMYLTKETALHPVLAAVFEAAGHETYRVVVPAAAHGDFTDGGRFDPRLLPIDGTSDAVLGVERGFTLAFLDHELRGAPETVFRSVTAPTDVYVNVYPLGTADTRRGPLP